jgi:hypothetical protein
MSRFDQRAVMLSYLQVGRAGKGRTATTRCGTASVRPPNLVLPTRAHVHMGRRAHTHIRALAGAGICIQVRQGKEVRRTQCLRGLPPSDLSTNLLTSEGL